MPYLNIDLDFMTHPKTLRLESQLGGHRAMLLPIKLWIHAGKYHSDDGYLKGYNEVTIARALGYDYREATKLVEALTISGFIVKKKDGYQVHDWSDHNGHLAIFRERAKTAAQARWSKAKGANNPPPPSEGAKKASKQPLFSLTEDQIHEIRMILAKKLNHRLISTANENAWNELKSKLEKAMRKRNIENLYTYAITCASNLGGTK